MTGWKSAAGLVCGALILAGLPSSIGAQTASADAQVRTIAGSGDAGLADGPAASASFLLPVGIAVSKDGTVYVADQVAQRIRALSDGTVRTVAGSGELGPEKLSVPGGYRDGPAAQAQFNKPSGITVGSDGALYIADARNACIRKLDHGTVSTVIGKAGERKALDGDVSTGRLMDPRALAFDRAGNLYIADFGAGLRRFDRNGRLTTIKLTDPRALGVSVDQTDAEGTVVVSTPNSLVVHRSAGADETYPTAGAEGGRPFGHPDALAALGRREVLFTDDQSNNVHYLRLPVKPYVTTVYSRTISGADLERLSDNAGFRDGAGADARFYAPAGIALQGNSALVTDAGNRRIRRIELPRFRLSEAGSEDAQPVDAQHFEVAYVGPAPTFYDSLGDDSICAGLETALNRANRFGRPARCHPARIDGATPAALRDYLTANVIPRKFNLIILQADPDDVMKAGAPASTAFKDVVADVTARARPLGTRVAVVWTCTARAVHGPEDFHIGELGATARELPIAAFDRREAVVRPLQDALRSLSVPEHDLFQDVVAYERTSGAQPLFSGSSDGGYPHAGANALLANAIATFVLSLPTVPLSAARSGITEAGS